MATLQESNRTSCNHLSENFWDLLSLPSLWFKFFWWVFDSTWLWNLCMLTASNSWLQMVQRTFFPLSWTSWRKGYPFIKDVINRLCFFAGPALSPVDILDQFTSWFEPVDFSRCFGYIYNHNTQIAFFTNRFWKNKKSWLAVAFFAFIEFLCLQAFHQAKLRINFQHPSLRFTEIGRKIKTLPTNFSGSIESKMHLNPKIGQSTSFGVFLFLFFIKNWKTNFFTNCKGLVHDKK